MGTAKRERQKANRQQRLEEMAKQARKQKSKRFGVRVFILIACVVALVGVLYLVNKDDGASTPPAVTVTVTTLVEGSGPAAVLGDTVEVHYIGTLTADGSQFDSSYDRGEPISVTLGAGQVIEGWEQGLLGVQVGGKYQLDIPAVLAYGAQEREGIPPNSALTFVIEVVSLNGVPAADSVPATETPATDTAAASPTT